MTDYVKVKPGKLKLKGSESLSLKKKAKKRKVGESAEARVSAEATDIENHGGWWSVQEESEVKGGSIAIETYEGCYVMSMDNGKFTVGPPHPKGEGPNPEEILTLLRTPDSSFIALKSGYGKYLGVNSDGVVIAVSEAISNREKWEFVFQDGKVALQSAANSCFLGSETDKEGYVLATNLTAGDSEMIKPRTNMEKNKPLDFTPDEDKKASKDCEIAYRFKFQHSKIPLNEGSSSDVKKAKGEGNLHEVLLNRRSKMKSDKYC